jgi:chromate reductase
VADDLKVLGIAGSLRRESYNRALLRTAARLAPPGMTIESWERLGEVPLFDEDLRSGGQPEAVADLWRRLGEADGLLIATPEYNYGIPGVLKNAIDWVSRPPAESPLRDKPAALMGASTGISGTIRAQGALRQVFSFTETQVLYKPGVFIAQCAAHFDREGGELVDAPTIGAVRAELAAFAAWIRRWRDGR